MDGTTTELVAPTPFEVEILGSPSLPAADRVALLAFHKEAGELQRAVRGANAAASDAAERIGLIKRAIEITPNLDPALYEEARSLELRLRDIREAFTGDPTLRRRAEAGMPGILGRIGQVIGNAYSSTSRPTATHRRNIEIAELEFAAVLEDLRTVVDQDLASLERRLEEAGAPWTPGRRIPRWTRN